MQQGDGFVTDQPKKLKKLVSAISENIANNLVNDAV
jgi:hypothetical protein